VFKEHQNGIQIKENTVRVKITQTWTNNAREKNQGDLIETFTGIEKVDMGQFFELSDTGYNLRGHSKRLTVNRMPSGLQKVFL